MADPAAFPQHDAPPPPPPPPPPQQPAQQQQQHLAPDLDGSQADDSSGGKRKRQSEGGPGTRSKRSRYISIACNECKRRKIKCNGEQPCQRCGNLDLNCVYAPNCCTNSFRDTTEFKQMTQHMFALQDQLEGLWHTVNHMRTLFPNAEIPMPPPPPPRAVDIFAAYDSLANGGAGPADPHTPPTPAPASQPPAPNIDPSLGMATLRKALETHRMGLTAPFAHTPLASSAASPRYGAGRDPSASQLSYELARASMESMGIAGAGARPEHGAAAATAADDDNAGPGAEDAAVAAAAAAAASAAGEPRDERAPEPDHQRALAELLHNAELQQQISQHGQGGHGGAGAAPASAGRHGPDVKSAE